MKHLENWNLQVYWEKLVHRNGVMRSWVDQARSLIRRLSVSLPIGSLPLVRQVAGRIYHPWFCGWRGETSVNREKASGRPIEALLSSLDVSAPILFLARGHSGTTPLARILSMAGVHIGNTDDPNALNRTLDALYWVYGFQRTLVPRFSDPRSADLIDEDTVLSVGLECLRRHLGNHYQGGPWGFKTCAGMFSHPLYQCVFPRARYIHLVRDGRDVVLSGNGFLHLSHPLSRYQHWEYFKYITFGLSGGIDQCPFEFPEKPHRNDQVMRNRFWVQGKSWREHVLMVEHLREQGRLSSSVYTIRYEDLCQDPVTALGPLFDFLDLGLTDEVKAFAEQHLYTESVGRWKQHDHYIHSCDEDMELVFASMEPELEMLGYPT